jgi:hypothetical protein
MVVHRYDFDLLAAVRFRELINEYGRMRRLEGMTPLARGQQFNELVAELLRSWGLERVQANVRSVGEIDVTFAVDGTRFLLEAKWEQAPVSFDPIAKLSRRITQRLAGTRTGRRRERRRAAGRPRRCRASYASAMAAPPKTYTSAVRPRRASRSPSRRNAAGACSTASTRAARVLNGNHSRRSDRDSAQADADRPSRADRCSASAADPLPVRLSRSRTIKAAT